MLRHQRRLQPLWLSSFVLEGALKCHDGRLEVTGAQTPAGAEFAWASTDTTSTRAIAVQIRALFSIISILDRLGV